MFELFIPLDGNLLNAMGAFGGGINSFLLLIGLTLFNYLVKAGGLKKPRSVLLLFFLIAP